MIYILQMGYQPSQGLGKKLQGVTVPIEANLKKGRGAIGNILLLIYVFNVSYICL